MNFIQYLLLFALLTFAVSCKKTEPQIIPFCENGIQDNNETGIDCGIVCNCNCYTAPINKELSNKIEIKNWPTIYDFETVNSVHTQTFEDDYCKQIRLKNDTYEMVIFTGLINQNKSANFDLITPPCCDDYRYNEMSVSVSLLDSYLRLYARQGTAHYKVENNWVTLTFSDTKWEQAAAAFSDWKVGKGKVEFDL